MTKQETQDRNNFFRDCLIEELQNHGFDCEPSKDVYSYYVIEIPTIAGMCKFHWSYQKNNNYMIEFYRAMWHIGLKLANWGLNNKILEEK